MLERPYRFRQRWRVAGPFASTFEVLANLESYPAWWPEIKSVRMLDDRRAAVVIRSVLPYALRLELVRTAEDRAGGVLAVEMTGDLAGWDRWVLRPDGEGTLVEFTEFATLERPWLRRLGAVARPAFTGNHALMMRSCRRGLEAALAGYRIAGG